MVGYVSVHLGQGLFLFLYRRSLHHGDNSPTSWNENMHIKGIDITFIALTVTWWWLQNPWKQTVHFLLQRRGGPRLEVLEIHDMLLSVMSPYHWNSMPVCCMSVFQCFYYLPQITINDYTKNKGVNELYLYICHWETSLKHMRLCRTSKGYINIEIMIIYWENS